MIQEQSLQIIYCTGNIYNMKNLWKIQTRILKFNIIFFAGDSVPGTPGNSLDCHGVLGS